MKDYSNEELLQAIAVVVTQLTKRGLRVRLTYKNKKTAYAIRLETRPFADKIKTKKS
jgi:hypothetical protein